MLVPTMGALHGGHEALIRRAVRLAGGGGCVVVSIFVNPIQFGEGEDFERYPRRLDEDLEVCRRVGAGMVFVPSVEEMYPRGEPTAFVDEGEVSRGLCGRWRQGHFRGVCTVVAKLFHIIEPSHAIFGEKDWQQLVVIRRMVEDLNFPVRLVAHPTVREVDGLAMSSRNGYLDAESRRLAPGIFRAMREAVAEGGGPEDIVREARVRIEVIPGAKVEYVEAVEADSLRPLRSRGVKGRLMVAVRLGGARLIDNLEIPKGR